jgi:RHS repeat-associated protein
MLAMSGPLANVNAYRFSSKEWSGNAGLYYYGFRFYDPNLQRWLNRDPLGEQGGVNLYNFVGSAPINLIDPHGECTIPYPLMVTSESAGPWGWAALGLLATGVAAYEIATLPPAQPAPPPPVVYSPPVAGNVNAPPTSISTPMSKLRPSATMPAQGGPPSGTLAEDRGNGKGTIRTYGPDGRAKTDYDIGHDHGQGDPHAHDWDWSNPEPRGPARPLCPGE